MSRNRTGRGNAVTRRRRRRWLVATFGDGVTAPCQLNLPGCAGRVTAETLVVDRYPVPGRDGGAYRRGNVRPGLPELRRRGG